MLFRMTNIVSLIEITKSIHRKIIYFKFFMRNNAG